MMRKYSDLFVLGPRGSGRTYRICEAAKAINGTVVASTEMEAVGLREQHNINVISIDHIPVSFKGPLLFDHLAMLGICHRYEKEIEAYKHLLAKSDRSLTNILTDLKKATVGNA